MLQPSQATTIAAQDGSRPTRVALAATIRAVGLARLGPQALADFRRRPGPIPDGWRPIAPTFLKASDEQTVAAVAAVLAAVASMEPPGPAAFADWGVVAAPRFFGREGLSLALRRFASEGVWGVSPHLIPHFALHSPAGTLSLALGLHGPNLGIGGGIDSAVQGALAAHSWLDEGKLPGVWLVLSGHTPELVPNRSPEQLVGAECRAVALALTPATDRDRAEGLPRLRMVAGDCTPFTGPVDLPDLAGRLEPRPRGGRRDPSHADATRSIYRPHRGDRPSGATAPWLLATDPAGTLRVELVDGGPGTDRGGRIDV